MNKVQFFGLLLLVGVVSNVSAPRWVKGWRPWSRRGSVPVQPVGRQLFPRTEVTHPQGYVLTPGPGQELRLMAPGPVETRVFEGGMVSPYPSGRRWSVSSLPTDDFPDFEIPLPRRGSLASLDSWATPTDPDWGPALEPVSSRTVSPRAWGERGADIGIAAVSPARPVRIRRPITRQILSELWERLSRGPRPVSVPVQPRGRRGDVKWQILGEWFGGR